MDQAIQPALRKAEIFKERCCLFVIELGNLLLEARRYRHHLRPRTCSILLHLLHVGILRIRCRRLILANVRDVENGLAREEIQITQDPLLLLGELHLARRPPRIERLLQALQCCVLRLCLLAPRFQQFRHLDEAFFHRLQIGKAQLCLDDVNIAQRVNAALYMRDVRALKAAHHMGDSIHLADVLEELISQPLALRGALHKACNIDKAHTGGCRLFGMIEIRQHLEARIRHGHDAHIRLNRAERIVRRLCARLRDSVEQRAFSHIRQTDDSDFKIAHRYSSKTRYDRYTRYVIAHNPCTGQFQHSFPTLFFTA